MSFLGLYRDPIASAVTSRCDWRIDDLVAPERPATLYLVVPPSDISRTRPLIRLILNQIGRRLTEGLETARHRPRLLLMLDEFPALGRLDFFEQAMAFMAGYRIKAFLIAQSLKDVYDSLGGGFLLIPAGARLVGEYQAEVQTGQSRLRVSWTRMILPSGRSIVLDNIPAADAQGMAGLQDRVDRHSGRILAAAGLSTLLAIGAESGSSSDESDLFRAIRRGGADAVSDVGRQVVGRSLDRAPTLTIRPGAPLRVLLTKDLVLEPYRVGARP